MTRMSKILFVLISLSAAAAVVLVTRPPSEQARKIQLTPEQVAALQSQPAPQARSKASEAVPTGDDGEDAGAPEILEDGEGS